VLAGTFFALAVLLMLHLRTVMGFDPHPAQ
jgi:hypothetical protein